MKPEYLNCGLIELKFASSDGGMMEFSGYGAVFKNVDKGGDVIQHGAFSQYLQDVKTGVQDWPAMLSQHGALGLTTEDLTPVGVWSDMVEDSHGLKMTGILADTERGIELYKLMKMQPRPAINGLSIGYIIRDSSPGGKSGDPRRTLKRVDLVEISPVTFPMNGQARIGNVKSAEDYTDREFERLMLGAGFTRKEALVIMNQGFRHLKTTLGAGSEELQQIRDIIERNVTIFQ